MLLKAAVAAPARVQALSPPVPTTISFLNTSPLRMSCPGNEISSEWEVQPSWPSPGRKRAAKEKQIQKPEKKKKKFTVVCAAVPVTPPTPIAMVERLACPTKLVQKGVIFPLAGFLLQHSSFLAVLALEKGAAGC